MIFKNDSQRKACFANLRKDGLCDTNRVKFADAPFNPRKTLELLDAGMLDPSTLTDEQKSQIEVVQEDIRNTGSKALKKLNERIERGDTYRPKELWSQDPIRIKFKEPHVIRFKFKHLGEDNNNFSRFNMDKNRFSLYLYHDAKEDEYFIKSDEYPEVSVYLQGWGIKPEKALEYFEGVPDEDLIGFKRMDFFTPATFRKGYPHRSETSFYTNYAPTQSDDIPIAVINTKGGKKHAVHDLMHEIGHHLDIGSEPAKDNNMLRNIMLDFPADSYARMLNPSDKLGRHTDWADDRAEEFRGLSEAKGLTFDEARKLAGVEDEI